MVESSGLESHELDGVPSLHCGFGPSAPRLCLLHSSFEVSIKDSVESI